MPPFPCTAMRRVLATDLGIWPMLKNQERASDMMVASAGYWANLANYVLLYDQIVIPTGNLQILPVLRLILGEMVFDDLIRSKGIVLARFDQWFGYIGSGGIIFFSMADDPMRPSSGANLATSFFKPLDEAIDDALIATNPPSDSSRRTEIKNLLLDNIVLLPTTKILEGVKEEAYKDILGSPYLRDLLSLRNNGRSLDNLVGSEPNKVTVFNPHVPAEPDDPPEIRAVLRVAFENLLLSMGGHANVTEITGDKSTLSVLQAKGQRLGYSPEGNHAFAQIQKVSGVPDLGEAFAARQITSQQLIDLRYSKHCQALRNWFSEGAPAELANETLRRYVESVGKPSWFESLPAKALKFATTTVIGAVEPISGTALTALDTFLLSNWFPAKSPRLFMRQAKVMLANSPVIQPPIMRGRDRNSPCSCGSGKKFKKCCGRLA
jgi:hypothetical protein